MIEFNKVFIDIAPLIYYLEQSLYYFKKTRRFLEECCVFPFRNKKLELIQNFDKFLDDMDINLIDVDDSIAKKAAQIRAMFKSF